MQHSTENLMVISKCIKKFLVSVVIGSCCAAPAVAADKVKFNLAWLPQGSTGGILVAIAKGFYAEAGLDVSAVRGYGGQRTVNEIDQGLFEFGYGDPISVMLNRAQGGKTVMVGTINTRWPAALCYIDKPERKLQKPADLKGLSLGGGAASPLQNIVPSWLQANKLPADHIKLLRLDPSVINSSFLEGRIDLAECWEGANKPILEALLQKDGKKLGWMRYRDFNLNLYGNGIVTTEKLVASNPDLVKRFVQATYRGFEYQRTHAKEAADAIAAQQKLMDKGILLQQITETNQIIDDPEADNKKLGWMRADRMQATVDFVKKAFNLQAPIKANDIYTNKFVE
ncbi:nitrate ABC transporter permease [Herbaspirillum sp. 3R11]|nr:nitrate ABC transporter permease [Herbaspirillum sp. 3R-3a1]TFI05577.1 nitrate ABC transporter permease [Herbaspirillum sp. 3R11]TFI13513.1 nitrate ABC transporter permease [Herbaspirillum sp. 3R-11]TFI22128.1 nitrate ABC transporter permease [Herbaspirillum sp. 3C11]